MENVVNDYHNECFWFATCLSLKTKFTCVKVVKNALTYTYVYITNCK